MSKIVKKAFLTLVFSGFFYASSLFAPIESEAGGPVEWVKPEEPTTPEEVQRMKDEAIKKRDEAQKALKEAQEKGQEEEARKEELKYQDARYELKTALIGEAKIKAENDPTYENKAKSIIEAQQRERQAIQDQITKLTDQLQKTYEKPTEPKDVSQKVQDFQDDMVEDFKNVTDRDYPVSQFVDDHFYFAKTIREKGKLDYQSQKDALANLQDFLNKNVTKETLDKLSQDEKTTYEQTRKAIAQRAQEIDAFLNNSPKKIVGNDFANKLNLSNKIPSDQVADIRGEIHKTLVDEGISKEEQLNSLSQAIQAMEGYKLAEKSPDLFEFYQDTVQDLKPKKEQPTQDFTTGLSDALSKGFDIAQQGVGFATEKMGDFAKTVKDNAGDLLGQTREKVGDFITRKMEENPQYIDPLYEKAAMAGKSLYENAQAYENNLQNASGLVETALKVGEAMNIPFVGSALERSITWAKGPRAVQVIKVLRDSPNLAQPIAKGIASASDKIIQDGYVKTIGEFGKSLAERATEERIKLKGPDAKKQLERAKTVIEQERTNYLTPEKRSRFSEVFKPVNDFFTSVKSWIKDQITTIQFKRAESNYTQARNDYMEKLFPDQAERESLNTLSEQERAAKIKTKLAELRKYQALRPELEQYDQALAKATYELAQVYKTYGEKLSGAFTNMEFMVKAWDSVYYDPKAKFELVGTINNVANLRDQRLTYLQAMKEGIDSIKKDLDDATQGTGAQGLNDVFTQRMTDMLNGQMIKTVQDNQDMITAINKALTAQIGDDTGGLPPG